MSKQHESTDTTAKQSRRRHGDGGAEEPSPKVARITYAALEKQLHDQSITSQQELYSRFTARGSWQNNHTLLSELMSISVEQRGLTVLQAQKLAIRSYYHGDSEAYRIAQELFTAPQDVVVPGNVRKQAMEQDPTIAKKASSPHLYSQLGLLYTRVPESLAVNLGLLEERKRAPRESLTDCATPRVILGLKYFFECIQPVGNRAAGRPNRVVLTITPPTQRVQENYRDLFAEYGVEPSRAHIGSILYTRHAVPAARPDTSVFPRQRAVQYFATAYDALRKTFHENSQYASEEKHIAALQIDWKRFITTDLQSWISEKNLAQQLASCSTAAEKRKVEHAATELNNGIVQKYGELLDRSVQCFAGSVHREKQAVYKRIVAMKEKLEASSTGRINPNPISLQEGANQALKQLRVEDIRIKRSYNVNDQDLLRNTLDNEAAILSGIDAALRSNAHILEAKLRLFTSRTLKAYEIPREASGIKARLNIPLVQLKEIRLRPFVRFKEHISEGSLKLTAALERGNQGAAKEALALMFHATRLARATKTVEELKISLIGSGADLAQPLARARQQLEVLTQKTTLYARPTGIETTPEGANTEERIRSLKSEIVTLQEKYLLLMQRELSESSGVPLKDERAAFCDEASKLLKQYDFEPTINGSSVTIS